MDQIPPIPGQLLAKDTSARLQPRIVDAGMSDDDARTLGGLQRAVNETESHNAADPAERERRLTEILTAPGFAGTPYARLLILVYLGACQGSLLIRVA
jgi:hypothetical protein